MGLWDHPHLPTPALDLAHPLAESAGRVEESAFVCGLPEDVALPALAVWQLVMEWSQSPGCWTAADARQLDPWEEDLLRSAADGGALWAPLAVIVGELRRPAAADRSLVAWSCLVAAERALDHAADAAALLFAQAAALAWPENPRYAWIAGKLLRAFDRRRDAELWLRRAERIAVAVRDWETQATALNSLGNLAHDGGDYARARGCLEHGLRVARRHRLREREATLLHDAFVLAIRSGEGHKAEALASQAFRRYGVRHPNLPRLAHDVAHFWADQGYFEPALRLYRALLHHSFERPQRLRLLGSLARAAGARGAVDDFQHAWSEAWRTLGECPYAVPAAAVVELGLGAASLGDWQKAEEALNRGRELAAHLNEHDTVARAEAALDSVTKRAAIDTDAWVRRGVGAPGDRFSREFEASLR